MKRDFKKKKKRIMNKFSPIHSQTKDQRQLARLTHNQEIAREGQGIQLASKTTGTSTFHTKVPGFESCLGSLFQLATKEHLRRQQGTAQCWVSGTHRGDLD